MSTTDDRTELLALADRLDAWSPWVSAGHECPAAGTVMFEAARVLRSPAADAGVREAWQDISTAPRDGTGILAKLPDSDMPHTVKFWRGRWVLAWDHHGLVGWDEPTHWMPLNLPSAPAQSQADTTEGE